MDSSIESDSTYKSKQVNSRVLLLADQPTQLYVMSFVAQQLRAHGVKTKILLTDEYTIIYGPNVIKEAAERSHCEILTIKELFVTWQAKGEPSTARYREAIDTLKKFSYLKSVGRNFDTLRLTCSFFNGFEFSSWYLRNSYAWEDVRHADILEYLDTIMKEFKPNLIASIDNSTFVTNALHALTEEKIRFLTFQGSRIGSRWVTRFDLAIGSHLKTEFNELYESIDKSQDSQIEKFLIDFSNSEISSYKAPSIILGEKMKEKGAQSKKDWLLQAARELSDIFIHFIRSVVLGPGTRKLTVRRFDQSFFWINYKEAKRRIYQLLPDISSSPQDMARQGYFFWPLHYRPEGSGLVLGYGIDELVLLKEVAIMLGQFDQILVVKENPMMFGTRKKSQLRQLAKIPNLIFAPRYASSKDWIRNSIAVIGISGTALLEACMLKVPSFAFGAPEFLSCVWSQSEVNFLDFIELCLSSEISSKDKELFEYLRFIYSNSAQNDVALNAFTSSRDRETNTRRLVSIILRHLL